MALWRPERTSRQIKAPVRLTAIAAALSGLASRARPSVPAEQTADGLGNGLSGRILVEGCTFRLTLVPSI